jgi:hypothetical protein
VATAVRREYARSNFNVLEIGSDRMKTLLCCVVTAVVTASATAGLEYARGAGDNSAATPAVCGLRVEGTGYSTHKAYVCNLDKMPSHQSDGFEVRLREIDLRCNAYPADPSNNLPALFACDRLSVDPLKCTDGVFGSWSMTASARRYEVDSTKACRTQAKPPGYKFTSGYYRHVFARNP